MQLHALINLYNDRTFLAATLESIKDTVNHIIVADGAYELYYQRYQEFNPQAKPYSTDGSIEIITHFQGKPITTFLTPPHGKKHCWVNQTEKRTALVEAVPVGDWFMIIDADEMIMGDLQESMEDLYESGCIVCNSPLYNPGTHMERVVPKWHPRVFKKTEGMHYKGTHWHLRDKFERIIEDKYPLFWTDKFAFVHFKPFRDQTRLIPHSNYMLDLMQRGWLEPHDITEVISMMQKIETGGGN